MTTMTSRTMRPNVPPKTLTTKEVAARLQYHPKTILRKVKAGTFWPKPFSGPPYRWLESDIDAMMGVAK